MRYRPPTIAEQGGLKRWMLTLDVNYELFKQLRSLDGQTYTTIAKALTADRRHRTTIQKPISPRTVKHWFDVDDEEIIEATKKN